MSSREVIKPRSVGLSIADVLRLASLSPEEVITPRLAGPSPEDVITPRLAGQKRRYNSSWLGHHQKTL